MRLLFPLMPSLPSMLSLLSLWHLPSLGGLTGRRARWRVAALALGLSACTGLPAGPALPPPPLQASSASATNEATPASAAPLQVRVLAINDFHGSLRPPAAAAATGRISAGIGALASTVQALRASAVHAVVVSAGDLIGASPLVSALFHDEPTIEAMNRLGLDIEAVGNHDFDAGQLELLRKQRGGCLPDADTSCRGAAAGTPVPFEGARFTFLAANVENTATGATLFPAYSIRTFEGVPVAFIGMTLRGTPEIVSPDGIRGLRFLDEATTVNRLVPELHRRGVQAIVLVIHQGGAQDDAGHTHGGLDGEAPNACNGMAANSASSPIREIVAALDGGVALVVSGHSHQAYNCLLHDRQGQPVRVTQASSYARMLTQIDLSLDRASGAIRALHANNLRVDAHTPGLQRVDAVEDLVDRYEALAAPLANRPVGLLGEAIGNSSSGSGEVAAAELIADAQLAATATPEHDAAQVAFMNGGGVRGAGFVAAHYPHPLTYGEVFGVQPFGNHLVVLTLHHQDLADLLEQQFPGCQGSTRQRLLQASQGFHQVVQDSAAPCQHVRDAWLTQAGRRIDVIRNGQVVQPEADIRVTVSNFLANGGDGFTVLQRGRNPQGGGQDIDALVSYLQQHSSNGAPLLWRAAQRDLPRLQRQP